jgi:HEAT repeat protein
MGGAAEGPVQLRLLADSDSTEQVRAAAIQAIGRSGDREAQDYLKGLASRTDLSDYLRRNVKMAIGQGERRLGK